MALMERTSGSATLPFTAEYVCEDSTITDSYIHLLYSPIKNN